MITLRWAGLIALLATMAGCPPETTTTKSWARVSQLSPAPVGARASLTSTSPADPDQEPTRTLVLSQGAALAFSCSWNYEPCTAVTSSDPSVLVSYRSLNLYSGSSYGEGRFVVTGARPGTAQLTVTSGQGTTTIDATVVP